MSNSWERWNVASGLEAPSLEDSVFKPLESSPGGSQHSQPSRCSRAAVFSPASLNVGSLPDGRPSCTVVTLCFRLDGDTYHMHALEKVLLFLASCFISFQKVDDLLIRKSILFHLVVRRY